VFKDDDITYTPLLDSLMDDTEFLGKLNPKLNKKKRGTTGRRSKMQSLSTQQSVKKDKTKPKAP